jgi:hypothetical protein
MDPFTILSLISQGGGLLSSLFGGEQTPENINPYTADFMNQLQGLIGDTQGNIGASTQRLDQSQSQVSQTANRIGQATNKIGDVKAPDPNAFMEQFMGNIPQYQDIARSVAEQAGRVGGRSVQENAQRASVQAGQNAARSTPGGAGFSGAQATAVGQAAANPLAEALNNASNLASQNYTGTFNQLAGQGQGLAAQGQQAGFQNALQQLQAEIGGLSQEGSLQGALANQNVNRLGQDQNQLGNLLSQYGANAGPVYNRPEDPSAKFTNALGGLGSIFGTIGANNDRNNLIDRFLGTDGGTNQNLTSPPAGSQPVGRTAAPNVPTTSAGTYLNRDSGYKPQSNANLNGGFSGAGNIAPALSQLIGGGGGGGNAYDWRTNQGTNNRVGGNNFSAEAAQSQDLMKMLLDMFSGGNSAYPTNSGQFYGN